MNYWITTHWPPRVDDETETGIGVWLPDGRQQAAYDMQPGDYIAIYESKSGRAEIRERQDGSTIKVACKPGREGMICYGIVDSNISAIPDSQTQKYADGSEIWWRWHTSVSVLSRSGFVKRTDLLHILEYKTTYNLRGFGENHSGLKKITESEFNSLVEAFHSSRPIDLPQSTGRGGTGYHDDGSEGIVHFNLKNYVAANPVAALNEPGLKTLAVEYEFPTNDRADIVLVDQHNRIIGVEVEPSVDNIDLVGLLQAIKYRYMLECFTNREPSDSRGILIAHTISEQVKEVCLRYGIECCEISSEVVDIWVTQSTE